jgi:hypothetical protein
MESQQEMEMKDSQFDEKLDLEKMKVENQEEQAAERNAIAGAKLGLAQNAQEMKSNEKKGK